MSHDDVTYQEILDRLKDMADTVAEQCIPDGRREGQYWRGNLHGTISVHIRGSRVGMVGAWQGQFGSKVGGNLISLIELAYGCKSHGEAVRIAKEQFLGISRRPLSDEERRRWAKSQEEARRKADDRRKQELREQAEKVESVRSIWQEAKPIAGTIAEEYLRSRAIELSDFPVGTTWMPSLKFHPALALGKETHPALIGGVQSVDRKLIAVWRIFLQPDGKALLDAEGRKLKLGLGPASGGAVRLGAPGPRLRLAEGIETALGVMLLTRCTAPVWATLSTSGLVNVQIPPGVSHVEIYADGDRYRLNKRSGAVDEPPGIAAAKKLQARLQREGISTTIHPSPEPDDWLDVWKQRKSDDQRQRSVTYL